MLLAIEQLPELLYKVYPSLRAVQSAFHRKVVVAQKENPTHQKRPAFLMGWIARASVIMIAGDHNNRGENRGQLISYGMVLRLSRTVYKMY